ncbi:hypothetical protein [Dehalogenimonas formicexedens]|uniref:hypothetical protein n=1 Tax=Dehalogenimonas formicexedens TaxID=1839801 RepID=UPI0011AB8384|nr:hypothetical protein [Dehalogenimonas formicexedens]
MSVKIPKFDTPGWLSLGVLAGFFVAGFNLWEIWFVDDRSFLLTIGRLVGMAIGIGLGSHCIDMIIYHRRHRSWRKLR